VTLDLASPQSATDVDPATLADQLRDAARIEMPDAVAKEVSGFSDLGGVSAGRPDRAWAKLLVDDGELARALVAAFDPDFGKGESMYIDCLSSCGFSFESLTCDRAKGKCTMGPKSMRDTADVAPSKALEAVLLARDLAGGTARCTDKRCAVASVTCDWPHGELGKAECQETIHAH
jgi:hypothetical protein